MRIKIDKDIKEAMRAKDELRLSVLRMLSSSLHNREIEKRTKGSVADLSEEEVAAVIRAEAKKRRDAIGEFTKGKRQDLVQKESAELIVLEKYLPQELSDGEIEKIVKEVMAGVGAVTAKDFGRVMGEAMKRAKGQVSGDRMSVVVRGALGL